MHLLWFWLLLIAREWRLSILNVHQLLLAPETTRYWQSLQEYAALGG